MANHITRCLLNNSLKEKDSFARLAYNLIANSNTKTDNIEKIWKKYYQLSDGKFDYSLLNFVIKRNPNTPPEIVNYLNNN